VATLLGEASTAMQGGRYDAAARLYDQVLQIDPSNAQAGPGKARALAASASAKKSFRQSRTSVRAGKGGKLTGFEAGGVNVADPDYSGRLQFEVTPSRVKPGDSYTVRVYLTNNGKKDYRVASLNITTTVNGNRQPQSAMPPGGKLGPGNRVVLAEISGVWPEGVEKWYTQVEVTTDNKDIFRGRVTWK
jgi:hypothetical protein